MSTIAVAHDMQIYEVFRLLFNIPVADEWPSNLYGFESSTCEYQTRLPMRYAGCGLRDSVRTSPAAYWGSWADALHGINRRFPTIGRRILGTLSRELGFRATLDEARQAASCCEANGWLSRPSWNDLAEGLRPPVPEMSDDFMGEWVHGWQFEANVQNEAASFERLLATFCFPSHRRNAKSPNKARLYSCRGRFSSN